MLAPSLFRGMSENSQSVSAVIRFGPFDADLQTQELRKHGVRLRLPRQSFQILKMLLERPGSLITREELRQVLWPSDTFVDFDHSLNAAVNRLREVLGDSADEPRLVETLPRRGYRFIGQLSTPHPIATNQAAAFDEVKGKALRARVAIGSAFVLVCVLAAMYAHFRSPHHAAIVLLRSVPFTALPGLEVAPSFSPDGAHIVFAWSKSGRNDFDLYVKSIDSENLRRLTNQPSQWISSAWSPDGSQIAFQRVSKEDTGLYLVPAEGGLERKLRVTHVSLAGASRISWSPDGKLIAFADSPDTGGHMRLHLLQLDTLQSTQIQHHDECQDESVPAFSPDGKRLAYICFLSSGEYAISLADSFGGTPKLLRKFPGWPWGLTWTANSQRLILCKYQLGDTHYNSLSELTLTGATVRQFSFGQEIEWPTFSAQGDKIAFDNLSGGDPVIFRQDLRNIQSRPVQLITSSRAQAQPLYSPDGKHIVFDSDRGGESEIWMTDSDGKNPLQLTNLKSGFGSGTPNWSPDSQKVVFDSRLGGRAGVYVVDIYERIPRKLITNLADASVPSWSRDGKWIYFIGGGSTEERIYRAPSVGGDATPLSALRGYGPVESFDGESVYFTTSPMATHNVLIEKASLHPTGTEGPVEGMPPIFFESWTLVRNGIYFCPANAVRSVSFFDFATKHVRQLFDLPQSPGMVSSVSPDGRYMLYSQSGEMRSDIMLVENFR